MALNLRTVFHVGVFSWYAFVVKTLAAKDGEELPAGIFVYGGPWKYLTFLNLVRRNTRVFCFSRIIHRSLLLMLLLLLQLLQMTFFGLASVKDLQPEKKSSLNRFKDLLFAVFAFPVGMVSSPLHK